MTIPPLAGICTYEQAAVPGLSVEDTVDRLVRYAWVEKRIMEIALYWLNPTPEWEIKEALSLHTYLAAQHAQQFRTRVSEMRNPPPNMTLSPDARLDAFFDELLTAETTAEKLVALYGVLKPALLAAYQSHFAESNPLVDYPTRRILRLMILEEEEAVAWGQQAIAALPDAPESEIFADHLRDYLRAAGGITGTVACSPSLLAESDQKKSPREGLGVKALPPSRVRAPFTPDYFPRRDERFEQRENFNFPPHTAARHEAASTPEKTLALMCKRALEMDVPEAMARMIAEAGEQPWEFYVDMTRQLWDECRHSMMGAVYFEHHGIDWKREIALHTGFSITLNQHLTPREAHAVLYAIEQGLMPARTGKKYEWVIADNVLAKLFQDYDWADEVLHVHIGRKWAASSYGLSRHAFEALGREKLAVLGDVITDYANRNPQPNWWPAFVEKTIGIESALKFHARG